MSFLSYRYTIITLTILDMYQIYGPQVLALFLSSITFRLGGKYKQFIS